MNRKEYQQWLDKFPEDTLIEVVVHRRGSGYYDQGGNATIEAFDPVEDGWGYNYNGHFDYHKRTASLLIGGINE